jgi:hypothetical protein
MKDENKINPEITVPINNLSEPSEVQINEMKGMCTTLAIFCGNEMLILMAKTEALQVGLDSCNASAKYAWKRLQRKP